MARSIVIIGAGQAAIAFAARLRSLDADCAITIVGAEPCLPYQRPPLSKKYLTGDLDVDRLLLRGQDWYRENTVECLTSRRATRIHPQSHGVTLEDGSELPFDKLLIATGAVPRKLPASAGGDLDRMFVLRNIADADALGEQLTAGRRLLIIGGGYIGLEVAAVARSRGLEVRIAETADRILQRVAAPATSDIFRRIHRERGVEIFEGARLDRLYERNDGSLRAEFAGGGRCDCDLAIAAIGVAADTELAEQAGLAVDNGIVVDETARTSHPDIYAAGDCSSFMFAGRRIRLESVQNAIEQAETAALNVAGKTASYNAVPWFWSDQYDVKLQIAGLHHGYDRTVTRPGSHDGGQSVWYFAGDRFVAVDAVNDPRAYMTGKRLLEHGLDLSPDQASDAGFDLRSLMK